MRSILRTCATAENDSLSLPQRWQHGRIRSTLPRGSQMPHATCHMAGYMVGTVRKPVKDPTGLANPSATSLPIGPDEVHSVGNRQSARSTLQYGVREIIMTGSCFRSGHQTLEVPMLMLMLMLMPHASCSMLAACVVTSPPPPRYLALFWAFSHGVGIAGCCWVLLGSAGSPWRIRPLTKALHPPYFRLRNRVKTMRLESTQASLHPLGLQSSFQP